MIKQVLILLRGINYVYDLHKNAYILINALREQCLVETELKNSTVGTIRTKLLKLGAIITVGARQVLISIGSACPYKNIFAMAYRRLSQLPCPG